DLEQIFILDFKPLKNWLYQGEITERLEILQILLHQRSLDSIVEQPKIKGELGLFARQFEQKISLELLTSSEFEAILTLLSNTHDDQHLYNTLLERFEKLLKDEDSDLKNSKKSSDSNNSDSNSGHPSELVG